MKIAFIGCVESSYVFLRTLLAMKDITVVAVVTKAESAINSDFCDLSEISNRYSVPLHYEDTANREATYEFLNSFDIDLIYCLGWSYLLPKRVIALGKVGAIGFHPAKLPENRGRHPLIWALVLGLQETASTFFLLDEGMDSGPIISQEPIPILAADNARTLYSKVMDTAVKQLKSLTRKIKQEGQVLSIPQDHDKATYWRKRTRIDGLIDWRMNAASIHNLIRALAPPYPGAEFLYKGRYIKVISSEIAYHAANLNIEPGKVINKRPGAVLVKCNGQDAIWLCNLDTDEIETGDYL
ncbi:methionyl-tRNA formyltransferase [Bowmanella yangjiangensis]|uniref:Methionyl-tRNA formyltransferase n=1 Tax=Bowmanella yangjiangensis TaxID=2811230 RepID=A0ABS3CRF0_9ALTE|nr:formyltransferase family protein [Bowmanella yangjiangensis]MBN7818875.1 hypothetical protein [Bowmanella yangjiangensis]